MKNIKLFYSTEDTFPPYRVDVGVLFSEYLAKCNVITEWYMRRNTLEQARKTLFNGQVVNLPYFVTGQGVFSKLINKVAFWVCDLFCIVKYLIKPIDIIQVRDKYIAAVFGLIIARLKGVTFIYWCSYPFPEHYLEMSEHSRGIRRAYCWINGKLGFLILYKLVMPFSHHTFVQSDAMLNTIQRYGVKRSKMTPVPMGVPDKIFSLQAENLRINDKQFVYIGTLAAVRRLDVLIEAFASVVRHDPSARLIIVGDGDIPDERKALMGLAKNLGIVEFVTFTGFLPMDEAWRIAEQAFCCISPFYPSPVLNVASPTKLVEYMALGKPVICNNHPEQKEILEAARVGKCVSWSAENFSDAMIWMLKNPEEATEMGKRGPEWVRKNRTYSVIAKQVLRQYQAILGRRS